MVKLKDLISFCDEYLNIESISDSSLNGLQVEGSAEVAKIALGVSVNNKLIKQAVKNGCQLIILHHGLLWSKRWQYVTGFQKDRIKLLLDNNISLAAYHLPLDLHAEIGNNAVGLKKLNVKITGGFGLFNGMKVGYFGKLIGGKIAFTKFKENVNKVFGSKSWSMLSGKTMVETVAFVSGGSRSSLEEAINQEIDVFISGETNESVPALVEESGINYIAAGHYNTEKFGVMELGKLLEKKFGVKTEFIDVPNNL